MASCSTRAGRIRTSRAVASSSCALPGRSKLIEIELGRGDVNASALATGAIVWKTDDPAIRKSARALVQPRHGRPPRADHRSRDGRASASRLAIRFRRRQHVDHRGVGQAVGARRMKFPFSELGHVREQLGRLGDTPFELAEFDGGCCGRPDGAQVGVERPAAAGRRHAARRAWRSERRTRSPSRTRWNACAPRPSLPLLVRRARARVRVFSRVERRWARQRSLTPALSRRGGRGGRNCTCARPFTGTVGRRPARRSPAVGLLRLRGRAQVPRCRDPLPRRRRAGRRRDDPHRQARRGGVPPPGGRVRARPDPGPQPGRHRLLPRRVSRPCRSPATTRST